jgi:hypothetical protein
LGAIVRRITIAAAVIIAAALLVAVPSVAGGQEAPGESTTTTEATTTTTRQTPNTSDDVVPTPPVQECDPAYPDLCIPPGLPDIDCGDIPFTDFPVLPPDPHGFDGDNDGIGCESGGEAPPPPAAPPAEPVTEEPDFTG